VQQNTKVKDRRNYNNYKKTVVGSGGKNIETICGVSKGRRMIQRMIT
jgi:hypothetical protein